LNIIKIFFFFFYIYHINNSILIIQFYSARFRLSALTATAFLGISASYSTYGVLTDISSFGIISEALSFESI
jgi:hypothetical protein